MLSKKRKEKKKQHHPLRFYLPAIECIARCGDLSCCVHRQCVRGLYFPRKAKCQGEEDHVDCESLSTLDSQHNAMIFTHTHTHYLSLCVCVCVWPIQLYMYVWTNVFMYVRMHVCIWGRRRASGQRTEMESWLSGSGLTGSWSFVGVWRAACHVNYTLGRQCLR